MASLRYTSCSVLLIFLHLQSNLLCVSFMGMCTVLCYVSYRNIFSNKLYWSAGPPLPIILWSCVFVSFFINIWGHGVGRKYSSKMPLNPSVCSNFTTQRILDFFLYCHIVHYTVHIYLFGVNVWIRNYFPVRRLLTTNSCNNLNRVSTNTVGGIFFTHFSQW